MEGLAVARGSAIVRLAAKAGSRGLSPAGSCRDPLARKSNLTLAMLAHQLSRETGVLTLAPSGPLSAADFAAVAAEVDPWIAEHGELRGLLIHTKSFPGWQDFAAFLGHLGFVRTHVQKIRRLAIASDS